MREIIAPVNAPQIAAVQPKHPTVWLSDVEQAILDHLRDAGGGPLPVWTVVNGLADASGLDDRTQKRLHRCRLLHGMIGMIRRGQLKRYRRTSVMLPTVAPPGIDERGSTHLRRRGRQGRHFKGPAQTERVHGQDSCKLRPSYPAITESVLGGPFAKPQIVPASPPADVPVIARPSAEEIRAAAIDLRRIPRGRRRPWTGYLNDGERLRRFALVKVPTGEVLPAYVVRRGWVLVLLPDTPEFALQCFARYRTDEVRRYKLPEATLLGGLKKGYTERSSQKKLASCRRNGRLPCAPGRQRGRPPRARGVGRM